MNQFCWRINDAIGRAFQNNNIRHVAVFENIYFCIKCLGYFHKRWNLMYLDHLWVQHTDAVSSNLLLLIPNGVVERFFLTLASRLTTKTHLISVFVKVHFMCKACMITFSRPSSKTKRKENSVHNIPSFESEFQY